MQNVLNSEPLALKMQELATRVEEAARSTEEGVRSFIEPAEGTLRRAISKRHHIIFGRRGAGKSTLLRKAGADLTIDRRPIAYVNLETFKGHSYPDILLSVLIAALSEFKTWFETAAIHPATRTSFWDRLFGETPSRSSLNKKESAELSQRIRSQINELEGLLHAADEADLTVTTGAKRESQQSAELSARIAPSVGSLSASGMAIESATSAAEVKQEYRRHKIDFLHRHIMDYQRLFRRISELSKGDSYLFLDDLYQVNRSDQPKVIDYFHRIAKDHNLWLKIATIRHRSRWYVYGDPPTGVKLGEDADLIDLDLTLDKYDLARNFLLKILTNFAQEFGLTVNSFLTEGAKDRLVLASGGVARDFLSIFRRSIDVARQRVARQQGSGHRGKQIGAEDVNVAAGEYEPSKREDFKRDTTDDDLQLDDEYEKIRNFCLDKVGTNCFLLNKDAIGSGVKLIHELVDLKLLHLVRSRVTVSGRRGQIYEAYMLDLSQYTGSRKRHKFKIIEFWRPRATETLRRALLIYEPTI